MFDSYLPFAQLTVHHEPDQSFHIRTFVFRIKANSVSYLILLEEYIDNLFIVKFYPAKFKRHPDKYRLLSNDRVMQQVIGTALQIFVKQLGKNKKASLGFISSSSIIGDFTEKQENNQRFRIYKQVMRNFFGQGTFTHFIDPNNSAYLMVNNLNPVDNFALNMQNGFRNLYPDLFNLHFTQIILRRPRSFNKTTA